MTNQSTLRDRIFAAINKLQEGHCIKYYPITDDEETGEPMFVCLFCGEIGHFPTGNGGIVHTPECAISLLHRIPKDGNLHFFDQLAYISILYQIASLERYPLKPRPGYTDWQHFCPFCQCFLEVTEHRHQNGRGFTITYTMPHNKNCIVTLAKAELEQQQGGEK